MSTDKFHHALKIDHSLCIGCTHCMQVCPTKAIRVKEGKANLIENRCIDCGECLRNCPVKAILVEQDDFSEVFNYKQKVALVPSVLMGQFSEDVETSDIYNSLYALGFTHVYEVENGVQILKGEMNRYMETHKHKSPLISSFCPAVIRLIQVRFPSLVGNIVHLKSPLDIAAIKIRLELETQFPKEDIGIFYVTPCAAKIAAVKSPVGEDHSPINGVINLDLVFNKISSHISKNKHKLEVQDIKHHFNAADILWSLPHGEANNFSGRCLSVDEVHNVIEFLEKIENEEITDINFLELRACDQGCAGGVLTASNRFLTVERLRKRAANLSAEPLTPQENININIDPEDLKIESIEPRSMDKLDDNIQNAIKKMSEINEMFTLLPKTDCGACGAPGCYDLAEDIITGKAEIGNCIFIQRKMEIDGERTSDESIQSIEKIWGTDKLNTKNDETE